MQQRLTVVNHLKVRLHMLEDLESNSFVMTSRFIGSLISSGTLKNDVYSTAIFCIL